MPGGIDAASFLPSGTGYSPAMLSRRHALLGLSGLFLPQGTQAKDALRIPIQFNGAGLPHLAVSFGDKGPYRFVIDTGSPVNGINVKLAPELGLMARTKIRVVGVGGVEISPVYVIRDIGIEDTYFYKEMLFVGLRRPPFADAKGMLGAGFVTGWPTEFDFEAAELRIHENGRPDFSAYHMLPSQRLPQDSNDDHKVLVEVTLDGMPLKLFVDTGASAEISLNSDCVTRLKLWDRYPVIATGHTLDVSSVRVPRRTVKVPNLKLGAYTIEATPVSLGQPRTGPLRGERSDGVIGMRTLRRFGICFDDDRGFGLKTRDGGRTLPYLWTFKPKSP
ncbi:MULTISPECIES: aspartyl protease family protein [Asticcacaulis]|uniref:aspartyl protease family protein n=1 Tax=Asticcacaulis TaxID=76890 RepID=UPI001AE9A422|nr:MULTISPECIES: aspartyl protease family protein [Asticcacaulis]MBP2160198.1 hypothetical protein [Asticcacaulis solisilvae]MDR6801243.1 hypothetical protein [Asticcacaulis sp. BE141]